MALLRINSTLAYLDKFYKLHLNKLPEAQKLFDHPSTILPSEIRMILSARAAILLS